MNNRLRHIIFDGALLFQRDIKWPSRIVALLHAVGSALSAINSDRPESYSPLSLVFDLSVHKDRPSQEEWERVLALPWSNRMVKASEGRSSFLDDETKFFEELGHEIEGYFTGSLAEHFHKLYYDSDRQQAALNAKINYMTMWKHEQCTWQVNSVREFDDSLVHWMDRDCLRRQLEKGMDLAQVPFYESVLISCNDDMIAAALDGAIPVFNICDTGIPTLGEIVWLVSTAAAICPVPHHLWTPMTGFVSLSFLVSWYFFIITHGSKPAINLGIVVLDRSLLRSRNDRRMVSNANQLPPVAARPLR